MTDIPLMKDDLIRRIWEDIAKTHPFPNSRILAFAHAITGARDNQHRQQEKK